MNNTRLYWYWSSYCTILVTAGLIRKFIAFMVSLPPFEVRLQPWGYFDYAITPLFGMLFVGGIKKMAQESKKEGR